MTSLKGSTISRCHIFFASIWSNNYNPFLGGFGIYFLNKHHWNFHKTTQIIYLQYFRIPFFFKGSKQFPKALVSHLAAAVMLRQSKIPYIFWMLGACGALVTRRRRRLAIFWMDFWLRLSKGKNMGKKVEKHTLTFGYTSWNYRCLVPLFSGCEWRFCIGDLLGCFWLNVWLACWFLATLNKS